MKARHSQFEEKTNVLANPEIGGRIETKENLS
jgi:hypothetical protein